MGNVGQFSDPQRRSNNYVNVKDTSGNWYNTVTPGFEVYNATHFDNYRINATQFGASGDYPYTFPSVAGGFYFVTARNRVGGSAAESDPVVSNGYEEWDGVNLLSEYQIVSLLPVRPTKNVGINNFTFVMVDVNQNPKPGLTVTATRRLDAGAYAACANAVTEIGNGIYTINLAATDMNADMVALRFTATAAQDRNITILTQP